MAASNAQEIVQVLMDVGIALFTQTMPAIKFILSKFLCQIKSGVEECATNEDIIGVLLTSFFIQPSQDAFESLP